MLRRFLPVAFVVTLGVLFVLRVSGTSYRNYVPKPIRFGGDHGPSEEQLRSGKDILPDLRVGNPRLKDLDEWRAGSGFHEPKVDSKSPYPVGKTKPAGSNYTRMLVLPKMATEDTDWIESELGDMIESGLLTTAIYRPDDPTAPLHPPKNKGNEAMVYLSYIIDFYDKLPDVSIFVHSHRYAWHNNYLLNSDASLMVRLLSPERVTREGYVNLRCHWEPGCPKWLYPGSRLQNFEQPEEYLIAENWQKLFPSAELPEVLSQPCCAQFAVSRDRIRAIPLQRFIHIRDWILDTELSNFSSGRVLEYTWQYLFTSSPVHCPSMSACYCDGYGLCFGDAKKFDYYFELLFQQNQLKEQLRLWNEKADFIANARQYEAEGRMGGGQLLRPPEVGKDKKLKADIEKMEEEVERKRVEAMELGRDPAQRAKEAGRQWKEGDGF